MTASPPNPLLSSHQPSDVQSGPIMGALMGQHNGRQITIEHAFECHTTPAPDAPLGYTLDNARFLARLEQFRTVHKDQKLDLIGWYTLLTTDGPTVDILPTHTAMLEQNDACLLLGFHPDELAHHSVGAKLPLSIYESNYEADDDSGEDEKMGLEDDAALKLKFRELKYTVEAGDAEMISMDFVARGGGNATAIDQRPPAQKPEAADDKFDTKRRTLGALEDKPAEKQPAAPRDVALSREEAEMISSLTAKANAIKMLQSRIQLIHAYLDQLPAAYKAGDHSPTPAANPDTAPPSTTILRQIQALVSRLDLVVPSDERAFHDELLREENDVHLVELLNGVLQSSLGAEEINRKARVVEQARARPRNAAFARDGRYRYGEGAGLMF